eukprot:3499505-Rhodomonas_salina.3
MVVWPYEPSYMDVRLVPTQGQRSERMGACCYFGKHPLLLQSLETRAVHGMRGAIHDMLVAAMDCAHQCMECETIHGMRGLQFTECALQFIMECELQFNAHCSPWTGCCRAWNAHSSS